MLPIPPQRLALYAIVAVVVLAIGWRSQIGSAATVYPTPVTPRLPRRPSRSRQVVVVDVVGAVRRPGRLPAGHRRARAGRRAKARAAAGADLAGLNLAERLADGEQVVVPTRVAQAASPAVGATARSGQRHRRSSTSTRPRSSSWRGWTASGRRWPSGSSTTARPHGGFRSLDELDQVSGIGPARLAALHGHVAL